MIYKLQIKVPLSGQEGDADEYAGELTQSKGRDKV